MRYWQNTIFTSSVQSVWFATSLVWSVQLASKCFMINKTLFFHFFSSKYGIYKFKTCLAIIFVFMIVLICSSRQFRLLSVKLMNIENHFFTRRQKAHYVGSIFLSTLCMDRPLSFCRPVSGVFDLETNQIVWKKNI